MPESGSTLSLWADTFPVPQYRPLAKDARADVCVIGAGIAGITTAYMLAKSGKSVIVLDDGPIGGGETVALAPGDSYCVPAGAEHTYRILETFTSVEATAPPAK